MSELAPGDPAFDVDVEGLRWAVERLVSLHAVDDRPPHPGDAAALGLPTDLAEAGVGEREALRILADGPLANVARLGHPGYLAHMDPPTPWVSWAAAMWAASFNQNLLHPDTAPVARDLERRVVGWLSPYFGMAGGHLVPSSTVANLTALWAAREIAGITTVAASAASHLSIRKAANMLGLELRELPVDDRGEVGYDSTGDLSRAALVLNAGTVASGSVDALRDAPKAAWRHVDAAWGGPLRLSARHRHVLDGIELADSVAVSAHKWLFQPKESAMVLFADAERAHGALSFGGSYLAVPNVGLLGSHGSVALPLAATLLSWGSTGTAARIDECMRLAEELAALVAAEPTLELWDRPQTGVVLWRPAGGDPLEVKRRLRGALVSVAEQSGERWLRSVAANPMANPALVVRCVRIAATEPG